MTRFELFDYETGRYVREATEAEARLSFAAAKKDNGIGVFEADGVERAYVHGDFSSIRMEEGK